MSTPTSSFQKPATPRKFVTRTLVSIGTISALTVALTGCFGGGKHVYQSVDSDVSSGGWVIIDGDSVTFVEPDSDGVQKAISDIEEDQINPNSDVYDVDRGALNEEKNTIVLEDGDSTSFEATDDLIRLNGDVVFVNYDSDMAEKDRGLVSPSGD